MDTDILIREQNFSHNILSDHLLHGPEEPFAVILTEGPGNGKSTVTKSMCDKIITYI